MWYIYSGDRCIGVCAYEPNIEDLKSRGQVCIFSDKEIKLTVPNVEEYEIPLEELLGYIRKDRDEKLRFAQNRVDRHNNQLAGNIDTTDSEETMLLVYQYMQELRDFPATFDQNNIVWPNEP
jgi:hypothetical protein